jgi:hypothetical protein
MFAFWDVLYRSWYPSEPTRNFRLGLTNDESKQFNRSVLHLYFYSFVTLWREIKRRRALRASGDAPAGVATEPVAAAAEPIPVRASSLIGQPAATMAMSAE